MLSFRKHNFRIRPIGADTNSSQQASNKAYKWLAVVASMVMLTSFTIASAAPTSNPPTGNVAPNFSGVEVSTKTTNTDASYAELRVSTDNNDGVILQDYTDASNYSRISVVNAGLTLFQKFNGNSLNQLLFSNSNGATFIVQAFSVITTLNDITLNAGANEVNLASTGRINLTAPEITFGPDASHGYFKTNSVSLSSQTYQRSAPDGNVISNLFVPCPADANGSYTGFAMACAYKVDGNQNLIFNTSTFTTDNSGRMGCSYNLNLPRIQNPSPASTSNVRARQLCYYGY